MGLRILILLNVLPSIIIIINFDAQIVPDLERGDIFMLAPLSFRNGPHCCLINAFLSGSTRYSSLILNFSPSVMEVLDPLGEDWY